MQILATNITSPLGATTAENYAAVSSGLSAIACHNHRFGIPEPFVASLFTDEQNTAMAIDGLSRFEALVVRSATEALSHTSINVSSERTVLILSTTKGNIEDLERHSLPLRLSPVEAAQTIARHLGVSTTPIVVSDACISGVAAQVTALRLIDSGEYDHAIVCGADCQCRFIVSGFQSLKAVSPEPCRPFDIERLGLNLGEAAATIVFGRSDDSVDSWHIISGAIRNDAFHISSPSPKGIGSLMALQAVAHTGQKLATVSVHGTATMYNDQMESKAISQAGLSDVPITALKGYFGHTMGAAGILETIVTATALADGVVLPIKGFTEPGVSGSMNLSSSKRCAEGYGFVKLMSGFGGCNGAVALDYGRRKVTLSVPSKYRLTHSVLLKPDGVDIDGERLETSASGAELLTEIYKSHIGNYPKYYKMDRLARLAFVAAQLLIAADSEYEISYPADTAVVMFNRSSSVVADNNYYATIADADNYFPSPSEFVYTLPNIALGEIAIYNHFNGETSLFILPDNCQELRSTLIKSAFVDPDTQRVIAGTVNYDSDSSFVADIATYHRVRVS